MSMECLIVDGLRVETSAGESVVADVSLRVRACEILGLVGESGSGKSTTALSILGWTGPGLRRTAGAIVLSGENVTDSCETARGRLATYVPQNPGTALNPALMIGRAIRHMIQAHRRGIEAGAESMALLDMVGLPGTIEFGRRYRHQISGGQQQRVCIAMAMAAGSPVVILDEPTTGLDVVTQAKVLSELLRIRDEQGIAMVYVSHDLSVVAQVADRVAVMYAGQIVEEGPVEIVLRTPRHPYTRGLIASIPDHLAPGMPEAMPGAAAAVGERGQGCSFSPRCPLRIDRCDTARPALLPVLAEHDVRCFQAAATVPASPRPSAAPTLQDRSESVGPVLRIQHLHASYPARSGPVIAAHDVSFEVMEGECVALVGESGSGKTTIARAIVGLHPGTRGEIGLRGESLPVLARRRSPEHLRGIQMVFQNPADALNPRHTVGAILERPLTKLLGLTGQARTDRVEHLLDSVRLARGMIRRYPRELSGGERQRVGIARALAADPALIVCDEITSALDVSVQAAVLNLLNELRTDLGLSLLFITHDLGVVAAIADRVMVLEGGAVCEQGRTAELLSKPTHPYTARLLASAPSLSTALDIRRMTAYGLGGDAPRTAMKLEDQHG